MKPLAFCLTGVAGLMVWALFTPEVIHKGLFLSGGTALFWLILLREIK